MNIKKLLLLGLIGSPLLGMERPPQPTTNDKRSHTSEEETDDVTVLELNLKIRRPAKKARVSYACQIPGCTTKSTNIAHLALHTLKHSDDTPRPFICNQQECGKSFKAKAHLANHMRAHNNKLANNSNIPTRYLCKNSGCDYGTTILHDVQLHELMCKNTHAVHEDSGANSTLETQNDTNAQSNVNNTEIVPPLLPPPVSQLAAPLLEQEESSDQITHKAIQRIINEDDSEEDIAQPLLPLPSPQAAVASPEQAKKFMCYSCIKDYQKVSDLLKHVNESHPLYHCKYSDQGCAYKTDFGDVMGLHERRHCAFNPLKETPKFICEYCLGAYYRKADLTKHTNNHHKSLLKAD